MMRTCGPPRGPAPQMTSGTPSPLTSPTATRTPPVKAEDLRRPVHERVLAAERFPLVPPEVVLLTVTLDVPEPAVSAKPRLWELSHERTLQAPDGPEGPRSPGLAATGPGNFL